VDGIGRNSNRLPHDFREKTNCGGNMSPQYYFLNDNSRYDNRQVKARVTCYAIRIWGLRVICSGPGKTVSGRCTLS
jgi:hypothetical protein